MNNDKQPSFDRGGYPTEETLQTIREWDAMDWPGLMDYLHDAWHDNGRFTLRDGHLELATGGWSGNEEILGALERNRCFHAFYWKSSSRGGLVIYERSPS